MKILVIHNRYQQAGGEDSVFSNEVRLLRDAGHLVETLEVTNGEISSVISRVSAAANVISSSFGYSLTLKAIRQSKPDIVHVHNFFPRLSPSVFKACKDTKVPVVWTLHNYRVTCANGLLFRDEKPCEDCVGHAPLPAVQHRCYRGSLIGSAAVATMIAWHQSRETWHHQVDRFIALSDFAKNLFVRAGLPATRITVKANFLHDPLEDPELHPTRGTGVLFVGRLSPEKGARTFIEAARLTPDVVFTVIGDGPEHNILAKSATPNVRFLGFQDRQSVLSAMANTRALIVPSVWYENYPMTMVEAMALGTPIIASDIGALASIIQNGVTGLLFRSGDPAALASVIKNSYADTDLMTQLGYRARDAWMKTMAPSRNLETLITVYRSAIEENRSRRL